jgi:hypothetical protein
LESKKELPVICAGDVTVALDDKEVVFISVSVMFISAMDASVDRDRVISDSKMSVVLTDDSLPAIDVRLEGDNHPPSVGADKTVGDIDGDVPFAMN